MDFANFVKGFVITGALIPSSIMSSLSLSLLPEKATLHRRCVLFERRERHWKMGTFPRSMCTRMSPMISHVQRELQEAEADAGVCGY